MAKQSGAKDPLERARQKLAKAQLKLHVAEEEHSQVRERGKQEVERARLRAARWLAKASKRIEQRAGAVVRAEARILSLSAPQEDTGAPERAVASAEAAADLIERRSAESPSEDEEPTIALAEGIELIVAVSESNHGIVQPEATLVNGALGYCMKCRDRRQLVEVEEIILPNGRLAITGRCAVCGTRTQRMIKRPTATS